MRNALAIMLFALAGCAAPAEKAVGMPNPASVHCTELGGKVEIRRDAKGEPIRKAGVMAIVIEGGIVAAGDDIVVTLPQGPHEALKPV